MIQVPLPAWENHAGCTKRRNQNCVLFSDDSIAHQEHHWDQETIPFIEIYEYNNLPLHVPESLNFR